ncbi:Maleylacetoacetate isomerase [Madurella mycetomatis]|uniref:Maleylacetoacetate isomerase n=1 Tax=Madurella mycetomatis TaxID=100816 RepID=A0A175WCH8_9PEZI|nr:Maleylacetoacetate isomerase [Madurella mycetomatis]
MSSGQIVLFDIPSKAPRKTWSLNPWKTRMLLSYKGLDFKTEWVMNPPFLHQASATRSLLEYPEIRPRLEPHLPPHEDEPGYTIPTIMLPDGRYVMDSLKIAEVIEAEYPTPSVHLDSPYHTKVRDFVRDIMGRLQPVYVVHVVKRILDEPSVPYWNRTRAEYVGMPLDQYEKENPVDKCWEKAAPVMKGVTALLEENSQGPFFMGSEVSYADFAWGGFLIFIRSIGEEMLEELLKVSGNAKVHLDLLEALSPWTERDDH